VLMDNEGIWSKSHEILWGDSKKTLNSTKE